MLGAKTAEPRDKGSPPEKNVFFRALPELPTPSNNDYDNGVSDNCDHNFGTFDDLVLKMTKKYHIT